MKNKFIIIFVIVTILVAFLSIKLFINDFMLIDAVMLIIAISLPIALVFHLIGYKISVWIKNQTFYFVIYLVYLLIGIILILFVDNETPFHNARDFLLISLFLPTLICNISITLYYFLFHKKV